jgi:tRNA U34 5-carboxymethylaminomethyl modifying GTPase MnmE/TrmE
LIDTAGLNPAPGVVEKLGIEKTFEIAGEADLFMVVMAVIHFTMQTMQP